MKRHRETILPPTAPKGPSPAPKGRVAATNTQQGECAHSAHALMRLNTLKQHNYKVMLFQWLHSYIFFNHKLFLCLDVDRRVSGQNDIESHEKLAQRIEKDVVRVFIHEKTPVITLRSSFHRVTMPYSIR